MPPNVTGRFTLASRETNGGRVTAYGVDASPALAVVHGVLEYAPRRPALVVSGINFGANLGIEVTISGTVGAALEAGAFGIPALAVSLEMDAKYHLTGNNGADYSAAQAFTQQFARRLLTYALPWDVDMLNVNVPAAATPHTAWQFARLSRCRYFVPLPPKRANGQGRPGYKLIENANQTEPDSDIWALKVDHVVSVTPLSLDLTSRMDWNLMAPWLRIGYAYAPLNEPARDQLLYEVAA